MDSKEVKATLKNAREAIRNKEYKEALKHCKSVLAWDKNNYNALVFVGVAAEGLDQVDQAVKAYKRAIESAPGQALAWQGLAGLYEKRPSPEHETDLISVYQKLQEIHGSEEEKKRDILVKLAKLYIRLGELERGLQIYEEVIEGEKDSARRKHLQTDLVDILMAERSLTTQHEHMVMELVAMLTREETTVTFTQPELLVTRYLDLLIKHCKVNGLLINVVAYSLCSQHFLIRWKSSSYTTWKQTQIYNFLETTVNKLKDLEPESPYLVAAQGYILLHQKNYVQARPLLASAAEVLKRVVVVHYCLAKTLLSLHINKQAQKVCTTCFSLILKKDRVVISGGDLDSRLSGLRCHIDYRIGTPTALDRAIQTLSQGGNLSSELKVLLGFIYLKASRVEEAQKLVVGTKDTATLDGWIHFVRGDYSGAILRLTLAVESAPDISENHLMLGKAFWEMWKKEKSKELGEKSYMSFLKAAKLDPYNSEVFLYLGHFSLDVQQDKVKATKCYQKAFDLDIDNDDAGAALCDLLSSAGQEEDAHKIIVSVTSKASAGSAKWAWLRLGLYQVKYDSPSVAITSFQSALRADPKDNHVWECLAEAYLHRGSLTAALKAFTKASELAPNSLYCLYQIAAIKQMLCMYTEAIVEYKVILERSPNYVPALKGVGETYLLLARNHLSQSFHGRARENCEDALLFLTRAANHRADMSCLWKLMGDACTLVHSLAPETFRFTVDNKLVSRAGETCPPGTSRINLLQTLELGARCYGRALKALSDCASLWHDLGVNFFYQSQQSAQTDVIARLSTKAVNSLKKALTIDPKNHLHWNALGRVFCSKGCYSPDKAQHCFIKSIQAEPNNVVAWSNLATLYFKNGNIELAHDAFKTAQSLEPSYVACWIGQALIAETVGHEDAMDLFRHTNELANHVEGATGYASWVCSMLKDKSKHNTELFRYSIKQMAAIPAASDALAKYLDLDKTNPTAYNMYGLLLEHQGLYKMAARSLKSALELCDDASPHDEEIRINYARILCKDQRYLEAGVQYDLVADIVTLEDMCNKGLALYKAGRYSDSVTVYTAALALAETEEEQSHVSVAMGMVHYREGDLETTKSVLFQSSQMTPPSRMGLLALCALGIIQTDMTLTLAVLQELLVGAGSTSQSDIAHLMSSANAVIEGNPRAAKNFVQQCIHKYPDQVDLWRLLGSVLVTHCHESIAVAGAATCVQKVHSLNPTLPGIMKLVTSAQLAGGHHSQTRRNGVLSSAQRAVHLNPDQMDNWCNLTAAIHSHTVFHNRNADRLTQLALVYLNWISSTFTEASTTLTNWCKRQRVISLVGAGRVDEAEALLCQLKSCADPDLEDFARITEAVMNGDIGAMSEQLLKSRDNPFLLEALLETCEQEGVSVNLSEILGEDQEGRGRRIDLVCKVLHVYYIYKQAKRTGVQDGVEGMLKKPVTEVQKLDSHCLPVMLVLATACLTANPRLAKHCVVKVSEGRHLQIDKGDEVSIARCLLIKLIYNPNKESEALKKLLAEAAEEEDVIVLDFYNVLSSHK
ncbi:LOW QUALITY PROTEIN: tetratricopeptide repeat protein 37-like [Pecten maximus]|uniref:LOW QUALITY PROTEIN: tetratricopeptide repeat protein 37-like n=1 Tax=Pecten maximus TaxID=6579 RepID=UPI0014584083|nr:LOW QUALITY PROTEIN: tetratricopeptide repeat protein 37-like [Pecten maximus]